ncbi:MAG: tRNA (N6-isopentenyl adenosine(37)-C2)-methylthiotransferase MiaB [Alphaproteobacteria bacterium]|nr:tRNA (N6-isopentenyl adenosine(37)-C2)-methylthiotransferase MiaB [Alphaproteobacteria bacterium]
MAKKKLFIKTYGCQMNVYDSLRMEDLMRPHGYEVCNDIEIADLAILNTCHIREKASEKVYSELGRIRQVKEAKRRVSQDLTIAVAGCVGQAEGDEIFKRAPFVNIVVGPQSYHSLPELVAKISRKENHLIELDFIEEAKFDNLTIGITEEKSSALVSVQEGCDKFCAFCVVPYTRGAEFSRPTEQIYREVLMQASSGVKEVTLLGQNVNAYHGKDQDGQTTSLAGLIKLLEKIKGLERIRYTTSHPLDMSDDLIELHGMSEKLMPFLHLPIQSGSNQILKAMNRKHTREDYLRIIEKLKKSRPDIALSSDFIVGFPGETDQDFEDTLDIVKQVEYSQCYSFKYSPRPGTPAAVKIQLDEEVKSIRLASLQAEIQLQQMKFNQNCVGKIFPVLFEKAGRLDGQVSGKSPYLQSVNIAGMRDEFVGKIIDVRILEAFQSSLSGNVDA